MAATSNLASARSLGTTREGQHSQQEESNLNTNADDPYHNGDFILNGHFQIPNDNRAMDEADRSGSLETSKSTKSGKKMDQSHLMPYKQGLRPDLSGSRSGSEPDSLLDLYGHPRSITERSLDSSRHRSETRQEADAENVDAAGDELEESRWIHRDKLAAIESQEMQDAGISPPLPRSGSKSRSRREKSEDLDQEEAGHPNKMGKKRKLKATPKDEEADEQMPFNEFDVRSPEEIAADALVERSPSPIYRQQTARSSSSRIPVPRSSPMPLPQEHLERTTPLPRKRNASGTWSGADEDGISYNRLRSRGNSVGSQVLLDEVDSPQSPSRPSSSGSPTKTKSGITKTSHARKSSTSTPTSNQKPRSASSGRSPSTPLQRPKSRSGLEPRPPTAVNRPEGEAPWLKDMYKPDPRLPPDQQLLPTHAKRLQEEQKRHGQWDQAQRDSEDRKQQLRKEANGTIHSQSLTSASSQQTSDFSPLAVHTRKGLQPTQSPSRDRSLKGEQSPGRNNSSTDWPLSGSISKVDGGAAGLNAGSLGSEKVANAGYSPIPRIRTGQSEAAESRGGVTGLRQPGDHQAQDNTVDPFEKERLERLGGKNETGDRSKNAKDKGCGCCVVM